MNAEPSVLPEDAPKLAWRRRQIVTLIAVALLLACALIGAIVYQQGGFWRWAKVHFIVDDAAGLNDGAAVRMSGFRVGKVSALQLQPDLSVRVELSIEKELFAKLRSDALAELVREQLRPSSIVLHPGTAAAPLSGDNPRVAFRQRSGLADVAEDLRSRLAPILDDMRAFTSLARERRGDIDALLENARIISQELASTSQRVNRLSGDLGQRLGALGGQSEQALSELNRSLVRMGGLLGQADRTLDSVGTAVPGLLNKANGLLVQFEGVMRDTRAISSAAAAGLPPVLQGAPPLMDETRELVQGVRGVWPLSLTLAPPPPLLLPIDSHGTAAARLPPKP